MQCNLICSQHQSESLKDLTINTTLKQDLVSLLASNDCFNELAGLFGSLEESQSKYNEVCINLVF
jgi:hypothetical protein